jgi:hypothetical protein
LAHGCDRFNLIDENDDFELRHPKVVSLAGRREETWMEKLSGKTALVTGSTDGVGRLVARKLGASRRARAGAWL